MKFLRWVWFLFLAAFLTGNVVFGEVISGEGDQAKPRASIQSDRPDLTDSPFTLDKGVMQLEIGWTYREHGNGSSIDSHQAPETLFRLGLETDWELRLGWGGYSFVDDMDDVASDISVGLKWHWSDQTKDSPAQGLLMGLSLPTGTGTDNDVDPSLVYAWSWEIDKTSSISGNIGISGPRDMVTGDRFSQGLFSISCSNALNDNTNWFIEYYTNFPAAEDQDAEHVVQTGFSYLVNNDLSFDFIVGAGLNNQADDFLVGVGLSYRF